MTIDDNVKSSRLRGWKKTATGIMVPVTMLMAGAAIGTQADIRMPVSTQQPFTIRGYNPGYSESIVVYRFTPAGSSVGGPDDTVFTVTVPSHAVDEETFPAGTGIVTEEPQIDPSTGEPYKDLILDAETYNNGGIQSLEQITLDQLANKRPLVGAYADDLYLMTGDTGGRVVLSQFTETGTTGVYMTDVLPANSVTKVDLATVFGGNKAPVSVEPYDPGTEVAAVMQNACNSEYRSLSAVDVSPRVAAAVKAAIPTKTRKRTILTQPFAKIILHDYFGPFIDDMLANDPDAQALFQNDPSLAQAWATQRSDGVATKGENPEIVKIVFPYSKGKINFVCDRYKSVINCSTGSLNAKKKRAHPKVVERSFNSVGVNNIFNDPVKYFGQAIQDNLPLTDNLHTMSYAIQKK